MIRGIKHVFFDLDHTLWDFDKNSSLAFLMIFEKFNINIKIEDFISIYKPINLKYWKLYREERISKEELRIGRLTEVFLDCNQKISLEVVKAISDEYIRFLPRNNYLIEGAIDLLEYLISKYRLHIITNGFEKVQNRKLIKSGIIHFFDTITNSDEVGVKKPNPLIFKHALQKCEAKLEASIMIGDNYEADIIGAEEVGLQTICFNYHKEKLPENILQVSSLSQIKNLI